jgi:hypothetical protein
VVARRSTVEPTVSDDARASRFSACAADAAAAASLTSRGPALTGCGITSGTSLELPPSSLRSRSFSWVSL